MKASIVAILATFFTIISVVDAARIKGGMRTKVEGHKERHLDDLILSMPKQMNDHNGDIMELLVKEGIDTGVILDFTAALDLSGARMTGGTDAKDWCAAYFDQLFDLLLFSVAVEDAIKMIICGKEEEEGTTTTTTTTSTTTTGCVANGANCDVNGDCCSKKCSSSSSPKCILSYDD